MIKFKIIVDGIHAEVQFPTATRPDDRAQFICSDLELLEVVNILVKNKSDERGMLMEPGVGTPIGVYKILKQQRQVKVSGGDNWQIRKGVM